MLITKLLKWLIVWWIPFGITQTLYRFNVNYIDSWYVLCLNYGIGALVAYKLFNINTDFLKSFKFIVILLFYICLIPLAYYFVKNIFTPPTLLFDPNIVAKVFYLDNRFIFSKTVDILFQQLMITALLGMLLKNNFTKKKTLKIFTLVFGTSHIPLLMQPPLATTSVIVISSFLGGLLMAKLILYFKNGNLYSFMLHWLFYVIYGVSPWVFPILQTQLIK